jgi:CHASE2 domain-containing sensor protein
MKNLLKFFLSDQVLATIFAVTIISLFSWLAINLGALDPFKRAFEDFSFTDIYYSKLKNTNNKLYPELILVNVGKLSRAELAKEIEIIQQYKPKVIGLDIFFQGHKDRKGDSLLANVVNNSDNVILATRFEQYDYKRNAFLGLESPCEDLKPKTNGFINIGSDYENTSTVRYFISYVKDQKDTIYSFAACMAMSFKPSVKKEIFQHKNLQTILYSGREDNFLVIDYKEVFSHSRKLELLKDQIVLMGYLGEPLFSKTDIEDKHFTPFNNKISGRSNPDMNGLVINANIVLMLLNGEYLRKVWGWSNFLISLIIIFLHVCFFIYLYNKYHKWYHVSTKIVQFVTSSFLLIIVFYLYHYAHLYFETTFTILVIIFVVDLLYFYEGLIKWLSERYNIDSVFNDTLTTGKHENRH